MGIEARILAQRWRRGLRTNVARKHEEVIVGQASVLLGVNECLDVDSVALGVLILEYFEGLGVVQGIGGGVDHSVAVGNGHFGKSEKMLLREQRRLWGI